MARQTSAIATVKHARKLRAGEVIRFVQDTLTTFHPAMGQSDEYDSVVFVGRVSKNVMDNGVSTTVDVFCDLLGHFMFNPNTLVEVISDPLGMELPYTEDAAVEHTAGMASRAILDEMYVSE